MVVVAVTEIVRMVCWGRISQRGPEKNGSSKLKQITITGNSRHISVIANDLYHFGIINLKKV